MQVIVDVALSSFFDVLKAAFKCADWHLKTPELLVNSVVTGKHF
jgi:hypothetical protein